MAKSVPFLCHFLFAPVIFHWFYHFVTQHQSEASVVTCLYVDTTGHRHKVKCLSVTPSLWEEHALDVEQLALKKENLLKIYVRNTD